MNRCCILIVGLMISNFFNVCAFNQEDVTRFLSNQLILKKNSVLPLSFGTRYMWGNNSAQRHVKYNKYYCRDEQVFFNPTTAIDLFLFPVVDKGLDMLTVPLKTALYMRGATCGVSPSAVDFVVDNTQLLAGAIITKSVNRIVSQSKKEVFSRHFFNNLAKNSCIQISCEAVDALVIEPVVTMTVGNTQVTWSGWAAQAALNYAFAYYFVGMVGN